MKKPGIIVKNIAIIILIAVVLPSAALSAKKDSSNAYYLRGNKYLLRNKVDKAIDNYLKAIQINPKRAKYFYKLAKAYERKQSIKDAILNYEKTITIDPTYYWAYAGLGNICLAMGDSTQATQYYEMCINNCPKEYTKHYFRGKIFDVTHQIDDAIAAYKEALRCRQDYFEALSALAHDYVLKNDFENAAEYYLRAKKLRCYDEMTLINLGIAYTKLAKYDAALDVLNVALKIDPFNRDTRFYLGRAYYGNGDLDQAINQTRRALNAVPDDAEVHFTLGLYYDKKGWHDMAVAEYQEALYLNPEYLFNKLKKLDRENETAVLRDGQESPQGDNESEL